IVVDLRCSLPLGENVMDKRPSSSRPAAPTSKSPVAGRGKGRQDADPPDAPAGEEEQASAATELQATQDFDEKNDEAADFLLDPGPARPTSGRKPRQNTPDDTGEPTQDFTPGEDEDSSDDNGSEDDTEVQAPPDFNEKGAAGDPGPAAPAKEAGETK